MPLSSAQNAQTENHQRDPAAAADEPALDAVAKDQPQAEAQAAAAMQAIFPAHNITPMDSLCPWG